MRLAAHVMAAAIVPTLAAAQSPSLHAPAESPQSPAAAAELATVDCAALANTLVAAARAALAPDTASTSRSGAAASSGAGTANALRSAALVATLCARAQREPLAAGPAQAGGAASAHAAGHLDPDVGAQGPAEPRMRMHAFADIRYSAIDSLGSRNGFALGQFDLFARSQLSENFSALSEMVVTALPRNQFTTKLERLLLTYSPSDFLSASAGRFHSGIGYYNATYHHGTWFQTATGRPVIFGTDGDIGIVPIHTLGISATGDIPSGALGLRYVAEIGTGRAGQSSPAAATQPGLNDNNTPSVNLGLLARPDRFDGLQVGVSVYRDKLTMQDTAKAPMRETITAAHVVYKTDLVEVLGEAVLIRHDPVARTPVTHIRGYYGQLSRRFGDVRPYLRVDHVDVPAANPLFAFLGRRSGPTLGIRYDFDALAAFKVQGSHLKQTTRSTFKQLDAQVSFMF